MWCSNRRLWAQKWNFRRYRTREHVEAILCLCTSKGHLLVSRMNSFHQPLKLFVVKRVDCCRHLQTAESASVAAATAPCYQKWRTPMEGDNLRSLGVCGNCKRCSNHDKERVATQKCPRTQQTGSPYVCMRRLWFTASCPLGDGISFKQYEQFRVAQKAQRLH